MGLLDDAIREHLELKRRRGADPAEVARAEQEALGPVRREPEATSAQETVQDAPHLDARDEGGAYPEHDAPQSHAPEPAAAHDLPAEAQTRVLPPQDREPADPGQDPQSGAALDEQDALDEPRYADGDEHVRDERAQDAHGHDEHEPPAHEPLAHEEPAPHAEPSAHVQPPSETSTPPHGDPAHDEPVDPRHSDIVHQPTTEWRIEDEEEPFAPEPAGNGDDEDGRSDEDVLEETPDFLQETPEHDRLWFEQRPPRDFDFDD